MNARSRARLAWSLWALSVALLVGYIPLRAAAHAFAAAPGTPLPPHGVELLAMSVPGMVEDLFLHTAYVAFSTLGAFIVARRPGNAIGWILCSIGLLGGAVEFAGYYAIYALLVAPGSFPAGLAAAWLNNWLWVVYTGLLIVFLPLRFPDGRPLSRRWRPVGWCAAAALAMLAVGVAFHPGPLGNHLEALGVDNPLGVEAGVGWAVVLWAGAVATLGSMVTAAASLGLRGRRARGGERQQIKWFVYGAALVTLLFVTRPFFFGNRPLLGHLPRSVEEAYAVAQAVAFASLPLCIGIAVLKHRLYDIDVLINRTLVYGALTGTLALLYFGSVILLQGLLRALTGASSQLAVVGSTLAIAALFQPLRRRLRASIDRRFYRRKYDAQQTLAAFSETLRDETDLERLSQHVLAVVEETMQPAHLSLWLREPEQRV